MEEEEFTDEPVMPTNVEDYVSLEKYVYFKYSSTMNLITRNLTRTERIEIPLHFIQTTVDYTNVKHLWYLIGYKKRLSQVEFNIISNYSNMIRYNKNKLEHYFETFQHSIKLIEDKYSFCKMYIINLDNICFMIENLIDDFHAFKNEMCKTNITTINEPLHKCSFSDNAKDNPRGKEWFIKLYNIYSRYGGLKPAHPKMLVDYLKNNWNILDTTDCSELTYTFEVILGGYTIDLIVSNLINWIQTNYDCIPNEIKKSILL